MNPLIELVSLEKTFHTFAGAFHALRETTLAIDRGEFVSIVGPSGSGKSTLLNVIGCLERPSEGKYRFDGVDVTRLDDQQLAAIRWCDLGFVFQSTHLHRRLTVVENVELPLLYARPTLSRKVARTSALEALATVGIEELAGFHPHSLTAGQEQQVAVARALVNHPQLLLADEPTGNLDSATAAEIIALLEQLNANGLTIFLTTEDPGVAESASRHLVLAGGRLTSDLVVAERSVA